MLLDSLVVRALARELDRLLPGVRVEKLHQPEPDTLVLRLWPSPAGRHLTICLERSLGHATLSAREWTNPPSPPPFCALLRKYLSGARLQAVRQPGLERILELELTAGRDGEPALYRLILELFGNVPNAYLLAEDGRILGACRPYWTIERLAAGRYAAPAPFARPSVLDVAESDFLQLARTASDRGSPKPFLTSLDAAGRGLAVMLLDETRAAGPEAAWHLLGVVRRSVELEVPALLVRPAPEPALVPWLPDQPPPACAPGARLVASASEAVESFLGEGVAVQRVTKLATEILEKIARHEARARQRLERAREDEGRAAQADLLERWGHLLQAHPGAAGPYATSVRLPDLFDPDAPEVEIPLRPGQTLARNAQGYFNRAARLRRAVPVARRAIRELEASLELLERLRSDVARAGSVPELRALKARLEPDEPARKARGKPSYRSYRSADGYKILVGRSDRENDQITQRAARKGDLWLHAHETAGAHVVVKLSGAECPRATLEEAAQLAAHYSPHRYSSKATIAYTRAENVKKPPGSPPGFVTLRQYNTLVIACDATIVTRLSSGGQSPDTEASSAP